MCTSIITNLIKVLLFSIELYIFFVETLTYRFKEIKHFRTNLPTNVCLYFVFGNGFLKFVIPFSTHLVSCIQLSPYNYWHSTLHHYSVGLFKWGSSTHTQYNCYAKSL